MWWYYKCVNLVGVLIQKSKVILFSMKKPCRRGSAPYRRSDWTSRLWGCPKNGLFKTTRERRALSLFFFSSLLTLLNCGTRRSYASRFRGYALQRAPVRWTLTSEPTIGGGLRLCQSRNGATNSTIAEESFPGDVTQPSQVSTREQPKEPEPPTWPPRTKNWTHAGKRNQKATACFTSTTDSKYNKQSVFILTKLVNSIWMQ